MATLLSAATATGAGSSVKMQSGFHSVTAYGGTSTGSGSATINIEVSNDGESGTWVTVATLTLTTATGATLAAAIAASTPDGASWLGAWEYARANITALSGTYGTINNNGTLEQTGIWVKLS